jgi:hypothetical protein
MAIGKNKVRDLREKWMTEAATAFTDALSAPDPVEKGKLESRGAVFVRCSADLKDADAAGEAE